MHPCRLYPSLFVFAKGITNGDRGIIFEDGHCVRKMDTMFGEIRRVFLWIPLEIHE